MEAVITVPGRLKYFFVTFNLRLGKKSLFIGCKVMFAIQKYPAAEPAETFHCIFVEKVSFDVVDKNFLLWKPIKVGFFPSNMEIVLGHNSSRNLEIKSILLQPIWTMFDACIQAPTTIKFKTKPISCKNIVSFCFSIKN